MTNLILELRFFKDMSGERLASPGIRVDLGEFRELSNEERQEIAYVCKTQYGKILRRRLTTRCSGLPTAATHDHSSPTEESNGEVADTGPAAT